MAENEQRRALANSVPRPQLPRGDPVSTDEQCAALRPIRHSDGTTEGLYCAGPRGHFNRHWAYDPIRRAMVRWAKRETP